MLDGHRFAGQRRLIDNRHTFDDGAVDRYHIPFADYDSIARLDRIGFNHICFAVSGIDALIAKATAAGVRLRNQPMTFHDRKLVFLEGPEGITVELAEWK